MQEKLYENNNKNRFIDDIQRRVTECEKNLDDFTNAIPHVRIDEVVEKRNRKWLSESLRKIEGVRDSCIQNGYTYIESCLDECLKDCGYDKKINQKHRKGYIYIAIHKLAAESNYIFTNKEKTIIEQYDKRVRKIRNDITHNTRYKYDHIEILSKWILFLYREDNHFKAENILFLFYEEQIKQIQMHIGVFEQMIKIIEKIVISKRTSNQNIPQLGKEFII